MGHATYMYQRAADGGVTSKIFDSEAIPEGWFDSPARVDEGDFDEGDARDSKELSEMTKAELIEVGARRSMAFPANATKAEIIDKILADIQLKIDGEGEV